MVTLEALWLHSSAPSPVVREGKRMREVSQQSGREEPERRAESAAWAEESSQKGTRALSHPDVATADKVID